MVSSGTTKLGYGTDLVGGPEEEELLDGIGDLGDWIGVRGIQ